MEENYDAQILTTKRINGDLENGYTKTLNISGSNVKFQVDTGSPISIVNSEHLNKIPGAREKLNAEATKPVLNDFGGSRVKLIGCVKIQLTKSKLPVTLWMSPDGPAVLGRDAIKALNLLPTLNVISDSHQLPETALKLKPDAQPIRIPPRRIAYALEEPTKREIMKMEEAGVISKVEDFDWAFLLFPLSKLRLRVK